MTALLAISPILLVLIGMTILKKPAMMVAPVAMVYTWVVSMVFFGAGADLVIAQTKSGIMEGLKIILLIFSAFTILKVMTKTGAIEKVKAVLADITDDRRAQLIIIAVMFAIFLEGAAGAGSPAAIAAPFLVGLGFNPVTAAACA
ncbi:MAG: L-lactate permease, partial [Peptococcaceae bacterium]|nr:L-lactate permease [Peptococcaceae bacterium]